LRILSASDWDDYANPFAMLSSQMVARLTPALGIDVPTSEELIRKAEGLVQQGHYEDALVVARMTLALLPSPFDRSLAQRAEDITEDCLRASAEEDE
jgi:hypothetical protein